MRIDTASRRNTSVTEASTVLLTTYRRNGDHVSTPVHVVWDGDGGVFRTWDAAGKLGRMWRNSGSTTVQLEVAL